ncbi:MAG: chromosomal replication initiator protein DnaA [Clostridiales bacterium]|nr:chromosomal replication initiator protein DnaA [Clostridiales bacterium]MCD7830059.1 chromosomal replication initiator protein DnaA [Clostridiales bacterium]MCD7888179.1 chromosomal replication initiator protein DnaA [Clostridiales bacterium]
MNSAAEVWASVLPLLENELTATAITTWFSEVEALELEQNRLVITHPVAFKGEIIRSRYTDALKKALRELFAADMDVVVLTPEEAEQYRIRRSTPEENTNILMGSEDYTFDRFVVGSSNKFAYNASLAVANQPGKSYNPLFLYGESGLGKTHLLYAIFHAIQQQHPDYQIIYVKGDEFTNELNEAIRLNSTDAFRQKYRDKDLLLVDDIQFIAGKDSTQEEFFNTFNNLYEAGKQIVLTSDRPPSDMVRLEDRLRTRFEWGLMADIQPPDYETRCAIIKEKAILLGLNMPQDIIEYIAQNITANVRQLEGSLHRLMAYRDLLGNQVDDVSAGRAIRELIRSSSELTPAPDVILEETAKFYGISKEAILTTSRKSNIIRARQVSMYIIRSMTSLSLPEIGKIYDMHHTTVMHSIDKIENSLKTDKALADVIKDIKANINDRTY